jgi:hypothetical protein
LENKDLASEAMFLIKSKEIGHDIRLNTIIYPGGSKRLELLLLTGYLFNAIKKR